MSNEKIPSFEEKCEKLEKDLSTLKGKEKVNETSVDISPCNQLENELNAKVEGLLLENAKLQSTLKGFTDSSIYMDRMLDGIGNHSHRQGLGFNPKKNVQKGKPNRVYEKRVVNEPRHSHLHDDTYFFDECLYKEALSFMQLLLVT